jgi:SAM-dependent methyltransferase
MTRSHAHESAHAHEPAHEHAELAHQHGQHQDHDEDVVYDQAFWEARYGTAERIWSGHPNAQLVAEATGLTPGAALDMGCGEGGDALWLAEQGWRVTAVDLSTTALARGAAEAGSRGPEIADRITWQHADVVEWAPEPGAFDLVSAQFLHPAPDERVAVLRALGDAVRPGGVLLYVGHDLTDADVVERPRALQARMWSAADAAASLDPAVWDVEVVDSRPRTATGPDGAPMTHHDAVLRARRRP